MLSTPATGLSVTRATPVSKKSSPGVTAGFSPVALELGDRLDAQLGHLDRVLLRRRADRAVLDRLDARVAAAVDGDDGGRDPGGLQRLRGADAGRLVDGVDEVDVLGLGQAGLHRGPALVLGALGRLVADDL